MLPPGDWSDSHRPLWKQASLAVAISEMLISRTRSTVQPHIPPLPVTHTLVRMRAFSPQWPAPTSGLPPPPSPSSPAMRPPHPLVSVLEPLWLFLNPRSQPHGLVVSVDAVRWVVTSLGYRPYPLPPGLLSEDTFPLSLSGRGSAAMPLCLIFCLMFLSQPGATLHRHGSRETKKRVKEAPVVSTVAPRSGDFAFDLYRALATAAPDQNIFFSPLSISVSLAMLSLGARSDTKAQILEGLGLGPQAGSEQGLHNSFRQLLGELTRPRKGLRLNLGNALFISPAVPVQDAFLSAVRTLYLADTIPAHFGDPAGAQKQINDYVAKQTEGKIVDLVKDLDSTEVMVMVNYIFFKGKTPCARA